MDVRYVTKEEIENDSSLGQDVFYGAELLTLALSEASESEVKEKGYTNIPTDEEFLRYLFGTFATLSETVYTDKGKLTKAYFGIVHSMLGRILIEIEKVCQEANPKAAKEFMEQLETVLKQSGATLVCNPLDEDFQNAIYVLEDWAWKVFREEIKEHFTNATKNQLVIVEGANEDKGNE